MYLFMWDWTVFLSLVHSSEILAQCPIFWPLCGTSVGTYPSQGRLFITASACLMLCTTGKVTRYQKSQVWQILVKMMKNMINNMKRQYWNPETVSWQYSSWNNSVNGNIKRLSHVTTIKKKTSFFSIIVGGAGRVRFKYNISDYSIVLALCTTFCHTNTVKPVIFKDYQNIWCLKNECRVRDLYIIMWKWSTGCKPGRKSAE